MSKSEDSVTELRVGLVGAGQSGVAYARACEKSESCRLTAVCDREPERAAGIPGTKPFRKIDQLLSSEEVDAVIVATSVSNRAEIALRALQRGFSVLVEDPVSENAALAEELASVVAKSRGKLVCGVSRPLRFAGRARKLKELAEGSFGRPHRVQWTLSNRFCPEICFAQGDDRKGESPGSLILRLRNELDLLLWLCGEPDEVNTFQCLGKHHDAEVEDEVFVHFGWEDGTTGTLVASSGEIPGIDRLEMTSDRGLIVSEAEESIRWNRCEISVEEFSRSVEDPTDRPLIWEIEIPVDSLENGLFREAAVEDFTESVRLGGKPNSGPWDDVALLRLMNRIASSASNR